MIKKKLLLVFATLLLTTFSYGSDDSGHYTTRNSQYQSMKELEHRNTNIRDLISDCNERGISLSCHRAGKWFMNKGDAEGYKYLDYSCELGRGYSCRVLGDVYKKYNHNDKALSYFQKGCFRKDNKSCDLFYGFSEELKQIEEMKRKNSFWYRMFH